MLALIAILLAAPPQGGLEPVTHAPQWAVGFTLGDPTGLSVKRYLGGRNAWDTYAAFAYGPGFRLGGDYLWNLGRIEHGAKVDFDAYIGGGAFVGILRGPCGVGFLDCGGGAAYVGGRVPVGVELTLHEAPMTLGVEVAPGIGIGSFGAGILVDFLLAIRFLL